MKTCKSPTTNTPSDLRHPWSRKTFSLCQHKTKGRRLFKEGARVSENFKFRAHSISNHIVCLPRNKAKSHCAWQKQFLYVGLLNFLSSFVSSVCSVEKKYLNLSWNFSNTFQSFWNKHRVFCKQPGHILILLHTMADTWSMKYFLSCWRIFRVFFFFVVRTCGAREHVHVVKQVESIQDICRFQMQSLQRRVQDAACLRLSSPTPSVCPHAVCWSTEPTFGYLHWASGPINRNIARACCFLLW